jgi:hypothetical protein
LAWPSRRGRPAKPGEMKLIPSSLRHDRAVTVTLMVRVVFVDAADGRQFAHSDLPLNQLPASFDAGTTLTLRDTTWSVERAEPARTEQLTEDGELRLTLRRVELVNPRDILFSLPTICGSRPALDRSVSIDGCFGLHEDDWRQIEFVDAMLADAVRAELDAVSRVPRRGPGFTGIHVRGDGIPPLDVAGQRHVVDRLPGPRRAYSGLAVGGLAVSGSFAFATGALVFYGLTEGVLGAHHTGEPADAELAEAVRAAMSSADVVLVDWCGAGLVGPADVLEYLSGG